MFSIDENGDIIDSELSDIGRSTLNQIKATFASDMDYASMLADTMGKAAIAENADGTYTNIVTNQKYVGKPEDAIVFETINGQQQPKQSDNWEKQKAEAEREVLNQVKSKLGIEETINPNIKTQDQIDKDNLAQQRINIDWVKLGLEKDKFNKENVDKATDLDTKREVISSLYGGTREDINSALTYYKDYGGTSKIQKVDRFDSGIEVTYENDNGDIITAEVSFYVPDETAKTMMPNPNYDPNKEEDAVTNPKQIKGRLKTEAQFIQSASQLLIGESVTEGLDAKLPDGSLKYNRDFTITPGMSVENVVTKSEEDGVTSDTFDIATNKYIDKILESDELDYFEAGNFQDEELAEAINKEFKDIGIVAKQTDGLNNRVFVRIPGINETITIDTNNFTASGSREEKQKLKNFIKLGIGKLKLQEKLNFEVDPKKGRFNKYNN